MRSRRSARTRAAASPRPPEGRSTRNHPAQNFAGGMGVSAHAPSNLSGARIGGAFPTRLAPAEAPRRGPVVLIVGHEGGRELQAEGVRTPIWPVDVLAGPFAAEVLVLADLEEGAGLVALAAGHGDRFRRRSQQPSVATGDAWRSRRRSSSRRSCRGSRSAMGSSRYPHRLVCDPAPWKAPRLR